MRSANVRKARRNPYADREAEGECKTGEAVRVKEIIKNKFALQHFNSMFFFLFYKSITPLLLWFIFLQYLNWISIFAAVVHIGKHMHQLALQKFIQNKLFWWRWLWKWLNMFSSFQKKKIKKEWKPQENNNKIINTSRVLALSYMYSNFLPQSTFDAFDIFECWNHRL